MLKLSGIPPLADAVAPGPSGVQKAAAGFGQMLNNALTSVTESEATAAAMNHQLATGEVKDIAQVMIASERAALTLQYTLAIRNKVLEAYQEIMRMPI